MAKKNSLKKNFILLAIYRVLMVIAPLIIAPYTSRVLGSDLVGEYSYYFSLVSYFTIVVGFGFADYGQRLIAAKRDNKEEYSRIFYEIMGAKYFLGLLVSALYFIINYTAGFVSAENGTLIFAIMFFHILGVTIDPQFLFMGLEKYKMMTIFVFMSKTILITSIFLFVKTPEDFLTYIFIYSIIVFVYPLLMYPFLFRNLNKPNWKDIHFLPQFKRAFVYFIPVFSITIYNTVDKSMIQWITKDNNQNGYYEQATKLVNVVINLLSALKILMLSRISYLYEIGDEEGVKDKTIKGLRTLFLLAMPCAIGICVIAKNFVPLFFGQDFLPAIQLIYALAPTIIFTSLKLILQSIYFSPRNKLWPYNFTIIFGTVLNIGLNVIFIHQWGALGAAIGSSISEGIVCLILVFLCRKEIKVRIFILTSYKPFISSIIMGIFGFALTFTTLNQIVGIPHYNFISVVILVLSCFAIYGLCTYLIKEEMFMNTLHLKQ